MFIFVYTLAVQTEGHVCTAEIGCMYTSEWGWLRLFSSSTSGVHTNKSDSPSKEAVRSQWRAVTMRFRFRKSAKKESQMRQVYVHRKQQFSALEREYAHGGRIYNQKRHVQYRHKRKCQRSQIKARRTGSRTGNLSQLRDFGCTYTASQGRTNGHEV